MKGFAPCLVVMLAGVALGVAGGFAWVTGDAYTGEHIAMPSSMVIIGSPRPARSVVPVSNPFGSARHASFGTISRGGEAT